MDWSPPGSSVHRDSPGKNTGVSCHALLQGIFPTQGANLKPYTSCIGRQVSSSQLVPPVFPGGSAGEEPTCNVEDLGLIPGLGRSPGEGKGYPLQYSGLENSTDCIVHAVAKSWARLSDFHFQCHLGSP